ncbi:HNH endonuclease signature motif containing protein [Gallaecimonas kandeliae]|uniref:HNH endonuclease signature motif containing protein n=1 Tax=Gallaecimonas kandeliae TaxID=3029055 RepID=UPI002649DA2B|nr:HNH endonuclease signature motif containing protein [Gallaecimonas kandeliae]WKE65039.1 HNH endonuclease signature motif containing protein [Gallaecimonas kandeliae]
MAAFNYTRQQIAWLAVRAHLDRKYLTQCFNLHFGTNLSVSAIKGTCKRHGIMTGRTGCFEKGNSPHNAGVKGWQAGGRSAETRFKKGDQPSNWAPIGSERLCDGYLQRKMTDTGYPPADWVEVHRLLWEEHHGPIPDKHVVTFKDGDKANITLDNLELISRAEHAMRNKMGFGSYPEELKPAVATLVKVKAAISVKVREAN